MSPVPVGEDLCIGGGSLLLGDRRELPMKVLTYNYTYPQRSGSISPKPIHNCGISQKSGSEGMFLLF